MSSPLHALRVGKGPTILLVHGSAADHTTWSIQLASRLKDRFTLIAYDRRADATTVEDHAADAAALLAGERALIVGSSFGAVVTLELVRTRPELAVGAVLIEPPIPPTDEPGAMASAGEQSPAAFLAEFDRLARERGGPAAGEFFLRTVLGDAAFERMPRSFQERAAGKWAEIRADAGALLQYRPRYAEMGAIRLPIQLLGGERSAPYFRATLDALDAALPDTRLDVVPGAGHMLHAEAPRRFGEVVAGFAAQIGIG